MGGDSGVKAVMRRLKKEEKRDRERKEETEGGRQAATFIHNCDGLLTRLCGGRA